MKPRNRLSLFVSLLVFLLLAIGGTAYAEELQQQATFRSPILVVNTSFLNVRTGPGVQYTSLVTVVGGTELPVLGVARDNVWYQVNTDGGPGWVNVNFTLPRGDFSNVPVVEVGETVVASLGQGGGSSAVSASSGSVQGYSLIGRNLRAQPDYNSLIISSNVPNDPNTIYPLLGTTTGADGATWYYVNIPNIGIGWTDTVQLRVLECGSVDVGILTSESPIRFDGISNRASFLLPAQTEGFIQGFVGGSNEFVRFQLVDGTVGLVPTNAVAQRTSVTNVCDGAGAGVASLGQGGGGAETVAVPRLAANRVIVNTGNLNVRSGPGSGYTSVATVPGGTELEVLGRATDNVWYFVEGEFGQGWLNSQFVIFRGNYSTVPVLREPVIVDTSSASLGQGGGGSANIGSGREVSGVSLIGRNLHQSPSYDSLILSSSVPNDRSMIYPLIGVQEIAGTRWYLVNVPNVGAGWMDGVELRILQCGSDQVGITTSQTPIRFDGIANRGSYLLDPLTEGYIVGRNGDAVLFELVDGTVGQVDANAIATRTGVISVCEGVSAPAATAGSGASVGATTGTSATVQTPTGNRVVINTGNLNVRSGPGAAFSAVATVPGGTTLAVIGRAPDGVWYYVEGSFGRGWLNNQFVIFRGDYSTVPVLNLSGN